MRDRPTGPSSPTARTLAAAWLVFASLGAGTLAAQQPAGPSKPLEDSVAARAKLIEAGRHVFHGEGTCFGCHGPNLEGTAIAPTLRAHKWRNGDGSLEAIAKIIRTGVPNTAMIAHPGGINESELAEVAAYVWAVSRGAVKP